MTDLVSVKIASESVLFTLNLWKLLKKQMTKLAASRSDRFLDYGSGSLLKFYAAEHPIAPGLTYVLVSDLISLHRKRAVDDPTPIVKFEKSSQRFTLSTGNSAWTKTASAGFTTIVESGRVSENETLVRIAHCCATDTSLVLKAHLARYHDQARSNLILDFDRDEPAKYTSLRSQLAAKYGESLPNLSDRRLANTLGAAILIFYRSRGEWIPYLVRRVKRIGVFPGGVHCSASGAVKWSAQGESVSFEDVTKHLLVEVQEELGLLPEDLVDLRPVAFCREMARGGKPQLFYCALTTLPRSELSERRKHAAKVVKELRLWKEIESDHWYRSADVVMTPSRLRYGLVTWGATLEGAAALFFGTNYLKDLSKHSDA